MNYKLHTPNGVCDYLPQECFLKKEIEKRIGNIFKSYGYKQVETPSYEFIEVFSNKGCIDQSRIYQFIDRDGKILALRADNTPPIARIAATNYNKEQTPLRFSYISNVFRYLESYQGRNREITQAGIELIGENNSFLNAEVLSVAIKSLVSLGICDFKINLGNVSILKNVLNFLNVDLEVKNKLKNYIIDKDFVSVKNLIKDISMPSGIKQFLNDLPLFVGGTKMLLEAKELLNIEDTNFGFNQLFEIYEIMKVTDFHNYIQFDLSVLGHFEYYTDLIFSGYVPHTGFSILSGGRYDNLIGEFGLNLNSVGFSINISELLSLKQLKETFVFSSSQVLVASSEAGFSGALKLSENLRNDGFVVEYGFLGESLEKNREYAIKKNIKNLIYFDSENDAKYIVLGEL